jgi:hypothetical protein
MVQGQHPVLKLRETSGEASARAGGLGEPEAGGGSRRLPPAALDQLLRLRGLGVEVIPLPTGCRPHPKPISCRPVDALHRLRERVDVIITPIIKRAAQEQEDLSLRLNALAKALHANLDRLPKVITLPINVEQGPIFETFAKVGLVYTQNLTRVRSALPRGRAAGLLGRRHVGVLRSRQADPPAIDRPSPDGDRAEQGTWEGRRLDRWTRRLAIHVGWWATVPSPKVSPPSRK